MIFSYKDGELCGCKSLIEAADLKALVVSVVGAGGKTTILHRLEEEFVRRNRRVIFMTTTRIMKEGTPYFLEDASEDEIRDGLKKFGRVWIGSHDPISGKTASPAQEILAEVLRWKLPILIEADGAKRMPLKVPAEHEPVILEQTGHVLSVYGLDAIGSTLESSCFRVEKAEQILQKNRKERITAYDIAALALSDRAGRKGCPPSAEYTVILNKADCADRRKAAVAICEQLKDRGVKNIVVTSFKRNRKEDGIREDID